MAKKTKHVAVTAADNPQRLRLKEVEDIILSWKQTGRLWDYEDEHVAGILKERDELFHEINPHLSGLSFHDVTDAEWDAIDKKVAETPEDDD